METNFFFSRDSEAAFRAQSATMGGSFWMFGAKMTETNGNKLFFSRDSEAAFGTQSATMGGWFWTRIRLGKAVAGPGVRGQDDRDKWKQTCFFSRDSEAAFGTQRAKMTETNGNKLVFFLGIQRQRLAPKAAFDHGSGFCDQN